MIYKYVRFNNPEPTVKCWLGVFVMYRTVAFIHQTL